MAYLEIQHGVFGPVHLCTASSLSDVRRSFQSGINALPSETMQAQYSGKLSILGFVQMTFLHVILLVYTYLTSTALTSCDPYFVLCDNSKLVHTMGFWHCRKVKLSVAIAFSKFVQLSKNLYTCGQYCWVQWTSGSTRILALHLWYKYTKHSTLSWRKNYLLEF